MRKNYIQLFNKNKTPLLGTSGVFVFDNRLTQRKALQAAAKHCIATRQSAGQRWEGAAEFMQVCNSADIALSPLIPIIHPKDTGVHQ